MPTEDEGKVYQGYSFLGTLRSKFITFETPQYYLYCVFTSVNGHYLTNAGLIKIYEEILPHNIPSKSVF